MCDIDVIVNRRSCRWRIRYLITVPNQYGQDVAWGHSCRWHRGAILSALSRIYGGAS